MSSNSRDYYHSSRSQEAHDRSLPPIRDVVGAELDGRGRPSPYTFSDVRGALPISREAPYGNPSRSDPRGPTLPPIQHSGYSSSRGAAYPAQTSGRHPAEHAPTQMQRYGHSGTYRTHAHEDSGHTYGVLRTSGTSSGALCDATPPQAGRPHGILRQTAVTAQIYDQDPEKKHKCDYCGKKFDRPSSLEVHLRTHTGSQPFACEWPGCDRTFSVRSNMLRHMRSHEKNSSSNYQHHGAHADEDENEEDDSREPSSSRTFRTSSSGQYSASQYYSSSRRK